MSPQDTERFPPPLQTACGLQSLKTFSATSLYLVGSVLSVSSPNPFLALLLEPSVAFQPDSGGSLLPASPQFPPSSPPCTSTPSVGGGGGRKGKEQGGGPGQQEIQNQQQKNSIKKEERKKKTTTTKKREALGGEGGRFNKKRKKTKTKKPKPKNQKDPFFFFWKKRKKEKSSLHFFFQNFVVKLQDIGPCFQKFPDSLMRFKCLRFLHLTGF